MVLNRVVVPMRMLATIAIIATIAPVAASAVGAQGRGRGAGADITRLDSLRGRVAAALGGVDSATRRIRPGVLLYGFALECTKCTQTLRPRWDTVLVRNSGDPVRYRVTPLAWLPYEYTDWPRVAAVAPGGPAERAGIEVGDSLVAVNGLSILAAEGTRQFNTVRDGDPVTLTLRRGGRELDVLLTLTSMDWTRAPTGFVGRGSAGGRGAGGGVGGRGVGGGAGGRGMGGGARGELSVVESSLPLRFEGRVGAAPVEVMSDSPLTVEMEASGDLVIHVAGSTVRVHPTATGRGGRGGQGGGRSGARGGRGAPPEP
jgi:membrane-associated protease RseP (regulator of RpoE activity)